MEDPEAMARRASAGRFADSSRGGLTVGFTGSSGSNRGDAGVFAAPGAGSVAGLRGGAGDPGRLGNLASQGNEGSADMKTVIALICIGILIFSWNPASLVVAVLVLFLMNQNDKKD